MQSVKTLLLTAVATVLCTTAFAADISSLSEITDLSGSYTLTQNVTLPENFVPIGTATEPFTGMFDGAGFGVTGTYSALFGYTDSATIKNICVSDSTLVGGETSGGIVANALGETQIYDCSFSGSVSVTPNTVSSDIGGIVGVLGENATVENCTVTVSANVEKTPYTLNFGGICGRSDGSVARCSAFGSIVAKSTKYMLTLGGIVAENNGTVEGSVSSVCFDSVLEGDACFTTVGGICGYNRCGKIERCVNLGNVRHNGTKQYPIYAGGIVGINRGGDVSVAKNSGEVTATKGFASGGIALNFGYKNTAYVSNVLNLGKVSGEGSVLGGIAANNSATDHTDSRAVVSSSLDISDASGIGKSSGDVSGVFSTGGDNALTTVISKDELIQNGVQTLCESADEWVMHTDISALPDLLCVSDTEKAQIVVSNASGDGKQRAYYLYTPKTGTNATAFYAVYCNGNRYLSTSSVIAEPSEGFTRLTATNIPENATKIRFIAFEVALSDNIRPARIDVAEVSLVDTVSPDDVATGEQKEANK